MDRILKKYAAKLVEAGLSEPGGPLLGGLDDQLTWNRESREQAELGKLFTELNINSALFCPIAEPYRSIADLLCGQALKESGGSVGVIAPRDCETRTFLHDLPVVSEFSARTMGPVLRRRKGVIVPGKGIVAYGTVSPEQAFVTCSSMLFACFVKYFTDHLEAFQAGGTDRADDAAFARILSKLDPMRTDPPKLMRGPFESSDDVHRAMDQAGKATVGYRLVDSYFGNLSYCREGVLSISQTGSSLDELSGVVDAVPLDGSSCVGLTASSEFSAHKRVVLETGARAILHGHPKFAVIMSMDCAEKACPNRGQCHVKCSRERFVHDIPIVPGEVGAGPTGLCNTLPPAMQGRRGVIVHGHGLFTVGTKDFNEPFRHLLDVENSCRTMYLQRVGQG